MPTNLSHDTARLAGADAPGALPVLVFARAPRPGACKTRLAARYGPARAARIHRQLVLRTLDVAERAACGPVQLWTAGGPHPFFSGLRARAALRRQPAGDLGRRMARALDAQLRAGATAALLVGTDCAALAPGDLRDAAALLLAGRADVVLQPAEDGGFVLIAARRPLGQVLRGIAWSSGRELALTQRALSRHGHRIALLRTLWDVDRPADLRRAWRAGLLPAPLRDSPIRPAR